MVDISKHEFTPQQVTWLRQEFVQRVSIGFDRPTMMWIIGGLTGIGIAVFGILWSEIGSVRDELRTEIGSVRDELRTEISSVRDELREEISSARGEISSVREEVKENRARIVDIATGLARIEAILEERLPRN